jgi:hypothetical protein
MGRIIQPVGASFTLPGLPTIFDPSFLAPNVLGWWAADQGVAVDGSLNITSWNDLSGNGNTLGNPASASNSLAQVIGAQNGKNIAQGNLTSTSGAQRWCQTAAAITAFALTSATPFTYVIALKHTPSATSAFALIKLMSNNVGSSNAGAELLLVGQTSSGANGSPKAKLQITGSSIYSGQGSTVLSNGGTYSIIATYDGSGAGSGIKLYVNGVAETMTASGSGANASMLNGLFELGGANVGQPNFNSADSIFEAFVMNRVLTASEATAVDAYLNSRWALH